MIMDAWMICMSLKHDFRDVTVEHHQVFLAPLPGRLRTSSLGESFTSFLFTLFLVCFVSFAWFCLPLSKKPKKISLVLFSFLIQKNTKKLVPALFATLF